MHVIHGKRKENNELASELYFKVVYRCTGMKISTTHPSVRSSPTKIISFEVPKHRRKHNLKYNKCGLEIVESNDRTPCFIWISVCQYTMSFMQHNKFIFVKVILQFRQWFISCLASVFLENYFPSIKLN